jgi:hypothetical protein
MKELTLRNHLSFLHIMFMLGLSLSSLASSPSVIAPAVYAQVQSEGNQIVTQDKIHQPLSIRAQTIINISGMEWDLVNNRMVIKQAGMYVIMTDIQVGGQNNGDAFFWIERNGSPIFESGKKQSMSSNAQLILVSNSWILPLEEGDSIRFMFSSGTPTIGLMTVRGSKNIPNFPTAYVPSSSGFNLTMYMLQKIGG